MQSSLTFAEAGRGVAAGTAFTLLNMQRTLAAATASDMGLVVPLTEAGGTLSYNLNK
jgi:hypothetical protein